MSFMAARKRKALLSPLDDLSPRAHKQRSDNMREGLVLEEELFEGLVNETIEKGLRERSIRILPYAMFELQAAAEAFIVSVFSDSVKEASNHGAQMIKPDDMLAVLHRKHAYGNFSQSRIIRAAWGL